MRRPEQISAAQVEPRESNLLAQRIRRRGRVSDLHVSKRADIGETLTLTEQDEAPIWPRLNDSRQRVTHVRTDTARRNHARVDDD
jgi:hypothetical protein